MSDITALKGIIEKKSDFQNAHKKLLDFTKDKSEFNNVAPILLGLEPIKPKAEPVSGNIYEGMVDLEPEQKEKWNAKIVESAIKAYQVRIAAYNVQATKLYEIIKAAMSEAVRLECHNRFAELWYPHIAPTSSTMEQPQNLWKLVQRTMTSSENGNHFAMALGAMKRLSSMKQTAAESLMDWNARIELEVNRAQQDGIALVFPGAARDQYALMPAAIKQEYAHTASKKTTQLTSRYAHPVQPSPQVKSLRTELQETQLSSAPTTPQAHKGNLTSQDSVRAQQTASHTAEHTVMPTHVEYWDRN